MNSSITNLLFPKGIKCVACNGELSHPSTNGLCKNCLLPAVEAHCPHCGRGFFRPTNSKSDLKEYLSDFPFLSRKKQKQKYIQLLTDSQNTNKTPNETALCNSCANYETAFKKAAAPFLFLNNVKHMVYRLKFHNGKYLAKYMADFMLKTLSENNWNIDFITYTPLSPKRLKKRGYNQAQLLAKSISDKIGLKSVSLLDKIKENKPLSRLSRTQRLMEIKDSIKIADGIRLNGQNILLIDDVFTTGATVNECAKQLTNAGASAVYILTFATSRTLL